MFESFGSIRRRPEADDVSVVLFAYWHELLRFNSP